MTPAAIADVWSMLPRALLADATRADVEAEAGADVLFATISGAHLYGFASPDSDVDVRGVHLLPLRSVLGVHPPIETITIGRDLTVDGEPPRSLEFDVVAHDLRKFVAMMVNHNGYVMEQLMSPLVLVAGDGFEELRALGAGCLTRPMVRHFLGFARGRRHRLREPNPTVKHALYAYRVNLSGLHLMREGVIESHLPALMAANPLPEVQELVARKVTGHEHMALDDGELAFHEARLMDLEEALALAATTSTLPEEPTTAAALEDFVIRRRLATEELARGEAGGRKG